MKTNRKTKLQRLIFERSLSVRKVAKMAGLAISTTFYATHGVMSDDVRDKIAEALGVPAGAIDEAENA